jgi:hypothetical protein
MYALFDQLLPRQQELHADLEVAVLDRVTGALTSARTRCASASVASTCRCAVPLCRPAGRRSPSVHGPFEGERVEERDGVLVAVDREMAVVEVDHRDARAHEP